MLTLRALGRGYRLLYSAVLAFMTLGTVAHAVHQRARAGLAPVRIAEWYRGNEADADAGVLLFPRPGAEVLDDVSTAATTYTLALLIFATVLLRSAAPAALRAGLMAGYAGCGLVAAAAPPLIRWVSARAAVAETGALLVLPCLALAMTVLAVTEMWRGSRRRPRFDNARTA